MIQSIFGMLPLPIVVIVAIMYHIGHNEYKKKYGDESIE